jgi:putative SOS response-associated peptidase YedK
MSYYSTIKTISDFLQINHVPTLDFTPTYHQIAQSHCKWPIAINNKGVSIQLFEWGVITDYMNTPQSIKQYRSSMVNARSEKMISDKKSVWHTLRQQRCLVFSTGFFEHQAISKKKKQPYFIQIKNQSIFCMAGLYNYYPIQSQNTKAMQGSFTILTRAANEQMQTIHNSGEHGGRMPLLLTKQLAFKWLQPNLNDVEIANIAAFEMPSNQLEAWPVHTIRTAKADNEKVIEKIILHTDTLF